MVAVYELGIHWECRQIIVGKVGEPVRLSDSDGNRQKQSCCHWLLLRAETVRVLGVLERLPAGTP